MASCLVHGVGNQSFLNEGPGIDTLDIEHRRNGSLPLLGCHPDVHRTCWCVNFIAENTRMKENSNKVSKGPPRGRALGARALPLGPIQY